MEDLRQSQPRSQRSHASNNSLLCGAGDNACRSSNAMPGQRSLGIGLTQRPQLRTLTLRVGGIAQRADCKAPS